MTDKLPIDVSSSTVNKLIDVAKDFLDTIVKPGATQVGLLIGEKIQSYRIMNQVNILIKVKEYVEKRGISISAIPLKILVPLLDHASLEEEEDLQDLWAKMLTNMLDSEENFQKHIFPYILSQISIEDYNSLIELYDDERDYWNKFNMLKTRSDNAILDAHERNERYKIKQEVEEIEQNGFYMSEADNIQRLGLIRQLPPPIIIPEVETTILGRSHFSIEAKYEPDEYGYRLTDLGYSFIQVCKFKEQESENKN